MCFRRFGGYMINIESLRGKFLNIEDLGGTYRKSPSIYLFSDK